jgi:predicted amidohydrolase
MRVRAVDNQMYVAMCSPARNPDVAYQAVSLFLHLQSQFQSQSQPQFSAQEVEHEGMLMVQYGHSMVVDPLYVPNCRGAHAGED